MAKFFKVDTRYQGETFTELINLDNVNRITLGANIIFFKGAGEEQLIRISITSESMHKLIEYLDMKEA